MTTFVTSDLHFNHLRILQYCPERSGPETSWDKVAVMNDTIIRNWNECVAPEDETYIIGDVAMGLIEKAPPLIRSLNGKKFLIRGNHDKTLVKLIAADTEMEHADLFEWIKDYHEMTFKFAGEKRMLVMSHFPMAFWHRQAQGSIMLHGHLHGSYCGVKGRIKDIGIDTNKLRPYRMEDVVREMLKIEVRESHHEGDNHGE